MEKRKTKLEDLDGVFELLNELYENKIEYSEFAKKYKESLENSKLFIVEKHKSCIIYKFVII